MEVPLLGDVVALAEVPSLVLTQDTFHFLGRPQVVFSLYALAVCVLSAEKAAALAAKLPQAIIQRLLRHPAIESEVPLLPGLRVAQRQQGIVVEGFFKVGRQPLPVGGIAGKAPADLVKDSAAGHLLQGFLRHLPGFPILRQCRVAQQKQQIVRRGELGRPAKAAILPVKGSRQLLKGSAGQYRVRLSLRSRALLTEIGAQLLRRVLKARPISLPLPLHRFQQRQQTQLPAPVLPGEIGPGKKRLLLRRHQHGERPSAAAVEGGADLHIDRVHVGALLPIHLHRHKTPVQHRCHILADEGLRFHHMTPVTGGVADGEEDGFPLLLSFGKGFLAPGIPVHRVFGMLAQIQGALAGQMVRHGHSPYLHSFHFAL